MYDKFGNFGINDENNFYIFINNVENSFIRTEADEVNYNLHILMRYDLEKELFSGNLKVDDLEEAWNTRFKNDFGLTVSTPTEGFLQDVHWSAGLFGYFPTYTLGNIYAGCLYEKILNDSEDYMIDVNQAWKIDKVNSNIKALNQFRYYWLEEPISADNSINEIINLINNHKNLAFGENITQINNFVKLNDDTSIKFLQPDIARYGGISQIISLKDKIVTDKLYLHYLGGAVGLITSAHLMSAINQSGFLEYDINENALRTDILKPAVKIRDGYLLLNSSIGIGFNLSEMSKNYLNQYYEL